jgi:hypothetical protein
MENCCRDVVEALGDRESLSPRDAGPSKRTSRVLEFAARWDRGLRAIPSLIRSAIDGALDGTKAAPSRRTRSRR